MKRCILALVIILPQLLWAQGKLLNENELNQQEIFFSMKSALKEPEKVLRLYLDSYDTLTSEIGKMVNLQDLDISGLKITELPSEISTLRMLQLLRVADMPKFNIVKTIDQIKDLPNLISLDFSGFNSVYLETKNHIQIPESIGELKTLKKFFLTYTGVESFPESMGKLINLEMLDLGSTGIKEVPSWIGRLKNLRVLNLGGAKEGESNYITELPDSIVHCINLEELDLNTNNDLNVKKTLMQLSRLPKLKSLRLDGKDMKEVPKEIGLMKSLNDLSLWGCGLTTLPDEIYTLPNLKEVDVKYNKFSEAEKEKIKAKAGNIKFNL